MGFLVSVLQHTLTTLYEIFGISLVVAVLFMFAWLYCKEKGIKQGIRNWIEGVRTSLNFRKMFLLAFYVAMILNKTLFCRKIWNQPFKNIIGVWGFYDNGALYTENVENIMLFLPYLALLMWALQDELWREKPMTGKNYWLTVLAISFGSSLTIEMLQLFLKVGAFQISDLVFNTLGGVLGAWLYWVLYHKYSSKNTGSAADKAEPETANQSSEM